MNKNKKKTLIISVFIIILIIGIVLGVFLLKNKNKYSLSLAENKWIDANKYNVIDVALINNTPILSYDGSGMVYDYLDYVMGEYSLKFNVIPYKLDTEVKYDYKMKIVDNYTKNDIVLLKDNFVLITKENQEYSDYKEIKNRKIGVLSSDKELISKYLNDSSIEYVEYNTYSELQNAIIESYLNSETVASVDSIIVLKTIITKEIISNDFIISYHFNDLNKYYVLSLGGAKELNSIIAKTYSKWENTNHEISYNNNLLNNYFDFKNITDVEQKKLKSKSYVYGFVNYGIYNYLKNDEISGLSGLILKGFNTFSGVSITYTKYNSVNSLIKDFKDKSVDFVLNTLSTSDNSDGIYESVGVLNKVLVIISGNNNKIVIDNINSLKGKEVSIIKGTYLEEYLISNDIKIRSYNDLKDLAKDFSSSKICVLELENYEFYKSTYFENSRISYLYNTDGKYNYVVNNTVNNKIFANLFNFYLSYTSMNNLITTNYDDVIQNKINIQYILIGIIICLLIYVVFDIYNHIKSTIKVVKKNKQVKLTKEEKIKYIDQLTSLKNRAYLNSKIEMWDDSEIYPQSIVVIDLNNISYINDNYGREEGDKVITEAANILIMNQLQNSEIIRTDGNEFLIYLVGYSEKQIVSYLRKLTKELKNLSHGFGAASGYSIIDDAIKTIDDAVNEATIDMKTNKEDIEY